MTDPSTDVSTPVALARMEAKLDVALSQHAGRLDVLEDTKGDHETRIRALEARSTVSPRALWTTVLGAAGLVLSAGPVIARLFPPS